MTVMTKPVTIGLRRFHAAHERGGVYRRALREIQRGDKQTHWMWFIFPQLQGLAKSNVARFYGIADRAEALAYLDDPILRRRLAECTMGALSHPKLMFDYPDNHKLRSCMTLFREVAADPALPNAVLEKFFAGLPDQNTLDLLAGKPVMLATKTTPPRGVDMGKHWEKQIKKARQAVAAVGQRPTHMDRGQWSRERVTSFVRGFGLSTVATKQMVDAWMADQARAWREGWEDGHEEGMEDGWNSHADSAYYDEG